MVGVTGLILVVITVITGLFICVRRWRKRSVKQIAFPLDDQTSALQDEGPETVFDSDRETLTVSLMTQLEGRSGTTPLWAVSCELPSDHYD
jgi:hypothetical protein